MDFGFDKFIVRNDSDDEGPGRRKEDLAAANWLHVSDESK